MQSGTILRHHGAWVLRYYETDLKDGQRVRRKAFKKLAPICADYPSKRSVEPLAWKILEPINTRRLQPESAMRVADFIENLYLPHVKQTLRPATYKSYCKDRYETHIKKRLGDLRLRDFRTVHGQKLIASIAKDNPHVGHKTLLRARAFLSGAFKHARREGYLDVENPMRDVSAPGKAKRFKGPTYSIQEIVDMGEVLTGAAFVAVAIAAFAGLRVSEIRGLKWQDFDGTSLQICRSVWRTHVGETKTAESEGTVPVLPALQKVLTDYRVKTAGKPDDWIFKGERRGTPLNLANLARRVIIPAFATFEEVQRQRIQEQEAEAGAAVSYTARKLEWRGWHAFRRSLASNLYALGCKPKIIQAIMRHSDIGTTLAYYVETPEQEAREALAQIDRWVLAVE